MTVDYNSTMSDADAEQFMLLSYLISFPELWSKCRPIISQNHFTGRFNRALGHILEYETSNNMLPTHTYILGKSGLALDDLIKEQKHIMLEQFSVEVENYVKRKEAEEFLINAAEQINETMDSATALHMVKEMERIASIHVECDLGYEAFTDYEELIKVADKSSSIAIGFPLLDKALFGGITKPSYNLVSAASGEGKSVMLTNIARKYSERHIHTVFISLELPEFMIENRILAMVTDHDVSRIVKDKEYIFEKMEKIRDEYGLIQIKRFPIKGTSVADIKSYVDELEMETGIKWENIIIDYPDLMKPVQPDIRADNIHMWDKVISEEIYEWAHDVRSPKIIWGASQQVKGAKDEKNARQSGVAGGTGKINTADNVFILKRSLEDRENGIIWCHIEKGRNGGTGSAIPFYWNNKTLSMDCPDNQDLRDMMSNYGNDDKKTPKNVNPFDKKGINNALMSKLRGNK